MRLICPNCDAQYEVPDNVVPEAGRDVQCSNCSNTWFFKPDAPAEDDAAPDPISVAPPTEEADAQDSGTPDPDDSPDQLPEPPQQQRRLDPAVADVLREEAEFEARARAAEREALETQPELGLDDIESVDEATRRAAEARERMARIRGKTIPEDAPSRAPDRGERIQTSASAATGAVAAASAAEGTRRGLLPNVEEINSTLRSDEERTTLPASHQPVEMDETKASAKGGFRRGFTWAVLLFAVALCLYVFAPQIAASVPQLAEPLASYVTFVDGVRGWLDAQVLAVMGQLDGLSSQQTGPASE